MTSFTFGHVSRNVDGIVPMQYFVDFNKIISINSSITDSDWRKECSSERDDLCRDVSIAIMREGETLGEGGFGDWGEKRKG